MGSPDEEDGPEEFIEEGIQTLEEPSRASTGRTVRVEPQSTNLRVEEFHTQDWLLIAEALLKTTSPEYSYTNFLENRTAYAHNLVPSVVAEAGVPSGNLYDHVDPKWGEVEPSNADPTRAIGHGGTLHVDPTQATRAVESFTSLDWLVIAEALHALIADLHLGGPNKPPRGGERVETLMNASVRAAGYAEVDNILSDRSQIVRRRMIF